jgi:hypothetical protein
MMRPHRWAGPASLLLLLAATPARAQPPAATAQPPAAQPAQGAVPSAEAMGVSLKAIRNQVKNAPEPKQASGTGLRYDFFVDVLGIKPPIDFFRDFDLSTKGGVRWGTPTHQEVLSAMSPYWVNQARPYGGANLLAVGKKKK